MTAFIVVGVVYAICGGITMAFVLKGLPDDPKLQERWSAVEELVGRWLIVLAVIVGWPYVAWQYRQGRLLDDR